MLQTTIKNTISCYGVGVHSGSRTQVTFKPAPAGSGVTFVRSDVSDVDNIIKASYDRVFETRLSTSVSNDAKISVSTVEHLMAALWGCKVDNILIELDGPEVPIMDGSSKPFVFMLECAGIKSLAKKRGVIKLKKEVSVIDNGCELIATPDDALCIDLTIDFDSPVIGRQNTILSNEVDFKNNIADSRTFGFTKDLDYLLKLGLAKGASLDNTIGIENDIILNHDGLRHQNEFVRHKMLDLLGDLYSSGGNIVAKIHGYKTSHHLNNMFLRKLFSDPYSYSVE